MVRILRVDVVAQMRQKKEKPSTISLCSEPSLRPWHAKP